MTKESRMRFQVLIYVKEISRYATVDSFDSIGEARSLYRDMRNMNDEAHFGILDNDFKCFRSPHHDEMDVHI